MPDSQVLVEKIVRLQRQIAKKQEKLDFLEEHTATMSEEVKKKNRIIVEYVMKAEAGILSTDNMDENKVGGRVDKDRLELHCANLQFAPFSTIHIYYRGQVIYWVKGSVLVLC